MTFWLADEDNRMKRFDFANGRVRATLLPAYAKGGHADPEEFDWNYSDSD